MIANEENFAGSAADAASPQPYDDDALPNPYSWQPKQSCWNRPHARSLEPSWQTTVATCQAKLRVERLQMPKNRPKQLLHHVAVTMFVRIRERVATRSERTTNRP